MAKSGRVIKLSVNMKPFVSRVVRDGPVQRAFRDRAKASNDCVAAGVRTGMSGGQVHDVVKNCAKQNFPKGTTLGVGVPGGARGYPPPPPAA